MRKTWDAIVVGLGGMGSAAACHLARRGARVLGLDRWPVPHDRGSSHGRTRIIRQAYFEGSAYVALVQRAWELWRELERASGRRLLTPTGGLMIGGRESEVVAGALASATTLDLPHELLSTVELRRRYPQLAVPDDTVALHEVRAGVLDADACVAAQRAAALAAGAELREEEPALAIETESATAAVVTTAAGRHSARRVVVAAGPWAAQLAVTADLPLSPVRVIVHWFAPRIEVERFAPPALPIFVWEHADGVQTYCLPAGVSPEAGVKIAFHNRQLTPCDPETVVRTVAADEIAAMRAHVERFLPELAGEHLGSKVCMYTLTPDHDFILGPHPNAPAILLAAGFSGHGFKFASAIGEALAELALDGRSRIDLAPFSPARFAAPPA